MICPWFKKSLWSLVSGLWSLLFFLLPIAHATPTYLRVHIESEPKTLDPAQATGVREFQILQALFEGLTRYHPQTLKPLPGVAQSWDISPDGLVYLFHLRKEAKWSDGKPITAQDFWGAWEHLLNPKTNAPYASQLHYVKGAKDYAQGKIKNPKQIGLRVVDPQTFEVTLEKPVPYFLGLTSFAPLAPRRFDTANIEKITNGPFVLESRDPQNGILLLPNPNYWGKGEVKLSGVVFRPFGDFDTALKYYDRTGIDIMADLPPQRVPLLKFRSDFRSAPLLRTEYFTIQSQKPFLNSRDLREALGLAIDRKTITEKILQRGDIPYGYFVPPGMPDYQSPAGFQTFDPWKAKRLLDKVLNNGSAKKFAVTLYYDNASDREMVAKAAQEMWQKYLGIKVNLFREEWGDYLKRRQSKDFEISWGGWYGDYVDPNTFLELFVSDHRQNHAGWSNPAYDELVHEAQTTQDLRKRAEFFKRAEEILLREAPLIPVLAKTKNYLIQPYVKGYYPNLLDIHPLRDVYSLRP